MREKEKEHSIFHYKTGALRISKCITLVSCLFNPNLLDQDKE